MEEKTGVRASIVAGMVFVAIGVAWVALIRGMVGWIGVVFILKGLMYQVWFVRVRWLKTLLLIALAAGILSVLAIMALEFLALLKR